jgi:deaminated glutathione amidase
LGYGVMIKDPGSEPTRSTLRVALAQIVAGADPTANLQVVADNTARAAERGAQLVLFPEATMRCFGLPLRDVAEPVDGPWAKGLRDIADHHSLVIIAGMFCPSGDGRVRNTLRALGPGVDAHYDKIHLFDALGFTESETVAPGSELVIIEVAGVPIGLTTCYDVRFPGLYTALADRGADMIVLAASWGAGPGKVDQWRLLTRARALDSTTYLIAAGQADPGSVGPSPRSNAPTGVGYSAAISPYGVTLAELESEPGLLLVDLDLRLIKEARAALPVLANRRF